jgi:hypothetical protein
MSEEQLEEEIWYCEGALSYWEKRACELEDTLVKLRRQLQEIRSAAKETNKGG